METTELKIAGGNGFVEIDMNKSSRFDVEITDADYPKVTDIDQHEHAGLLQKLWENANHGTREEDVLTIFAAGQQSMQAMCKELAEAILPFAGLLQSHNDKDPDKQPIFGINDTTITLGDLRKAVAALKKAGVEL